VSDAAPTSSAAEWARLRARVRAIGPRAVGRGVLAGVVLVAGLWLGAATWPALLPFAIGAVIAYVALPLVNALDSIMPRTLAALLSVLLILATVVGVLVMVLPPIGRAIGSIAQELPSESEIGTWIASLESSVGELPGPAGPRLAALVDGLVAAARDGLEGSTSGIADLAPQILQGVIGAVTALLGLVVLPAWILVALRDQRQARRAFLGLLPASVRPDASAVVRIADRAGAGYLRVQVPRAFAVGLAVWIGLMAAERLGVPAFREATAIAVLAGAVQVIPEIGGLLGFIPALLILPLSVERAVVYLVTYVASRWIAGVVVGRSSTWRKTLHPVIAVPAVIALSNFGLLWLLLAGPILAMAYDLVRYAHGRMSEPGIPAGQLPDEVPPQRTVAAPAVRRLAVRRQVEVSTGG
jgi:predicted PurR-regulated permease PerM